MPCFNEAAVLPITIPPVLKALNELLLSYELILVNNGSTDATGDWIDRMKSSGNVVRVDVFPNQGYGHGILSGLAVARGRIVGYMCCDGQVAPEDILRVFFAIEQQRTPLLAKLTRTSRHDGFRRWVITRTYNLLCRCLFPIESKDINGTPKFLFCEDLERLKLRSADWLLDFEVLVKANHAGLKLIEVEAPFYQRKGGKSYVRHKTLIEFVRNILRCRFGGGFRD